MQHDSFKKFSKDLQEAFSISGNFLNKQAKKLSLPGDKKKKTSQSQASEALKTNKASSDSCSPRELPLSDDGEIVSTSAEHSLAATAVKTGCSSPFIPGSHKIFPKEEPPIIHCPPSIPSLEQFSLKRRDWIQSWGHHNSNTDLNDVLKSGQAQDLRDTNQNVIKSAHSISSEATGLLFVKLMQVTNRATTKIFDVEWSLRVGSVERTSYPARSFKDNSGNTATMNEVFLFNVNEPFQLEMTVTGSPVPTKLGTLAGFSNTQASTLGQLELSFCLEPIDKSIRTYKLLRPISEDSTKTAKSDCEIVAMIGLHVLEEPVEDRSWETELLYQGFLTFMARGGRMASWKRYWAVLEGRTIKLYDAEYQQRRGAIGAIPLARILRVEPPDYDRVDVGANGLSMIVDPNGVDLRSLGNSHVDASELDYSIYAFTDSPHLNEVWNAHLEEALDQYRESMRRRGQMQKANMARRASQSLSRHSFESSVPPSPLDGEDEGSRREMIDVKFVW